MVVAQIGQSIDGRVATNGGRDYDFRYLLHAGYDESGVWQEMGEMRFQRKEDVTDAFGNPISGVAISWTVEGGGTVSEATVNTDSEGRASVERQLGPAAGPQGRDGNSRPCSHGTGRRSYPRCSQEVVIGPDRAITASGR